MAPQEGARRCLTQPRFRRGGTKRDAARWRGMKRLAGAAAAALILCHGLAAEAATRGGGGAEASRGGHPSRTAAAAATRTAATRPVLARPIPARPVLAHSAAARPALSHAGRTPAAPRIAAPARALRHASPPARTGAAAPARSTHRAAPASRPFRAAPTPVPAETAEAAAADRAIRRAETAAQVRAAAEASGFDPDMLLAIAMAESSLRESVRSDRSSAAGPLQFTVPTWLAAVHAFAERIPDLAPHRARLMELGEREAALAGGPAAGRLAALVALRREQAAARQAALALRHRTATAARVAALLAREDAERFRALTGTPPAGPGEIYAIHLLGVGAAAALARAERQRPGASVAQVLPPGVVAANRPLFRGPDGQPLSVREARGRIAARMEPAQGTTVVALAQAP